MTVRHEKDVPIHERPDRIEHWRAFARACYRSIGGRSDENGEVRFITETADPQTHLFPTETQMAKRLIDRCTYLPEVDREMVQAALALMFRGHQGQYRDNGQPYTTHPLAITLEMIKKYKIDAITICSALLHDTREDTPVTHKEIELNIHPVVASTVDSLSKIRGRHQRKVLVAEQNRTGIITSLIDNPRVAVIKTYDRLHNMRTIGLKNEKKKREIIFETQDIYIPLARIMGLHDEANELDFLCLVQTSKDHALWAHRTQSSVRTFFSEHKPSALVQEVRELLEKKGFEVALHYRLPSPSDLYRRIGSLRPIVADDLYLYMDIAQVDFASDSYALFDWGEQAVAIANAFTWNREGMFDRQTDIKASEFKREVLAGLTDALLIDVMRLRDNLRIKLTLYPFNVHVRARLPLAKMLSEDINERPELKAHLEKKHRLLSQRLSTSHNGKAESFQLIRQLEPRLPEGFIRVVGINDKGEEEFWSLQTGSTIMDYIASITPLSWNKAVAAIVNGEWIEIPDRILHPGDKVHIVYKGHGRYDPLWIHCFKTNPEGAQLVREKIEQRREMYETTGNYDDLYLLDHRIQRVGKWRLRTLAGLKSLDVGIEEAIESIRRTYPDLTEDEFYLKVGLGELKDAEIQPVVDRLAELNQNLLVLSIDFEGDKRGQLRLVGQITEKLGINIVNVKTDRLGNLSIITISLDPRAQEFVKKVAREIRKRRDSAKKGLKAIRQSVNHLGAPEKLLYLRRS